MAFTIQIMPSAVVELEAIRVYDRRRIAASIDEQLRHQPASSSRRRKLLPITQVTFDFEPPLWELRIGDFRVFYDVDEEGKTVYVRAVREKPPHTITEDVV